jgi:drug/metabolite transporter (DMT)-like permease
MGWWSRKKSLDHHCKDIGVWVEVVYSGVLKESFMDRNSNRTALMALLVVTIIWGWTFSWMKEAIDTSEALLGEALPLVVGLFMVIRFGVAALVMPIVVPGARTAMFTWPVWRDGGILAVFLLLGFLLQMFGLDGVDPAVSAFLTSLYVAFVALISAGIERRSPGWVALIGVTLVTVGAAFISGPPQLSFDLPEWLTVLCATLFAGHIVATDWVTRRSPPLSIAWTSFVWVGLGSSILLVYGWALRADISPTQIGQLMMTESFIRPALLAGLLGSLVALSLLTNFQKALSPVRAAILYSLEPVWAALIALALGQVSLDTWLLFGGGLLLVGNLWMEIWPRLRPATR